MEQEWGELRPFMDWAPLTWLSDETLSLDARRIVNWWCRSAVPLSGQYAHLLGMVAIRPKELLPPRPTLDETELRAHKALMLLQERGYVASDAKTPWHQRDWKLIHKDWIRPDGSGWELLREFVNAGPEAEISTFIRIDGL